MTIRAFIPIEVENFDDLPDEAFISPGELIASGVCPFSASMVASVSQRRWPKAHTFGKRKGYSIWQIRAQLVKGTGLDLLEPEDD